MANPENLRPFPKGHKFGGKPKGPTFATRLKKLLAVTMNVNEKEMKQMIEEAKEIGFVKGKKVTANDMMLVALIRGALKGDYKAAEKIMDRIEGKPVQRVESVDLTHEDWLERIKDDLEKEE